jgi:CMP-N-acetylneuraminic acid synthetase/spore coat polysaccharide biosynthesis predicted glycosyltransferase SpsG
MKGIDMNILAVIPARSGSKGIPNKNIRIIEGYPLVYYSIKNALESKLITSIVVTTDSSEVGAIAKQMGVSCKWRNKDLCGDDVTLDSVVADAIPEGTLWDYVVTMQPTSPTLSAATLDKALARAVGSGADTLISVKNDPRLAWGLRDGKAVPLYESRLNRQQLPPNYAETGAFMISRRSCVSPSSRIGERVEIFEVPESESFDIDTFSDLQSASLALGRQKVAIYVNGNRDRGTGHVYRALELADELLCKPDIFYDSNQTSVSVFGRTEHSLAPVNGIPELFDVCRKGGYTLFINDILDTSVDYMIGLRTVLKSAKIVNFEDCGEGASKADLVVNALLGESGAVRERFGCRYYLPGKLFMLYKPIEIRPEVRKVFVSFGGSDPRRYTERLLRIASSPAYTGREFVFALGRAKENAAELMKADWGANIRVLHDVGDMPGLMTGCDIGVTSRGRTCYELAMLGIPALSIAQNMREERHGFVCEENGFKYIGLDPPDETIEAHLKTLLSMSVEGRKACQDRLLSHDLRGGRKRVMGLISSL